jgi:hypothetical protein
MSGRKHLKGGAPRIMGRHNGRRGRMYRQAYSVLLTEFDLTSPLAQLEAGRVAVCWVNLQTSTESLELARRAREVGRGRRPSLHTLERLARRQGLADTSYSQALNQLRELVGAHRQPATIADLVTRRQQQGGHA